MEGYQDNEQRQEAELQEQCIADEPVIAPAVAPEDGKAERLRRLMDLYNR